jgi:inner membrane protein
MDNLTHSLVGLTAAKAGLDKLSPGVTTLCVLAANAPDSDVFVGLFADRWTLLHHHRGITHSIIGTICLAVVLPLLFYAIDRLLSRWRNRPPQVKLRGLVIASAIVTATHPFLDWLNSYGIRPFLPWDSRWAYGDLLFIVDPLVWLLLGCAVFQLTSRTRFQRICWAGLALLLTGLVAFGPARPELSHPNLLLGVWIAFLVVSVLLFLKNAGQRWHSKIAITGFALLVAYCAFLALAHRVAVYIAGDEAAAIAKQNNEAIARLAVMPTLANPLRWDCTFTTDAATYRFRLGLIDRTREGSLIRYPVPTGPLATALQQVSQDRRVKIFLDFARFPVARLRDETCASQTLVQFADLRYTEPGRSRGNFTLDVTVNCLNWEVAAR